ncbi:hypothetical protein ACQUQU_13540 [Thalassolituus sp. LLYu03]|uniref:hypothetical protein n=1 Tax=Thalassolituus sp. LLYu03 TaxID=3421656 RepID=UPI003D2AD061
MFSIKIKTAVTALMFMTTAVLSGQASAQMAGKNVILVHGLQPSQLMRETVTSAEVTSDGENYWADFWGQYADDRLDWSSKSRLSDDTAQRAYDKVIEWAASGFCSAGCVLVTHSTGDLVTRYLLDQQEVWTAAAGYAPLNILAVFDFAGAGGGSELADVAIDTIGSSSLLSAAVRAALSAWLGFTPTTENLGVLTDLRPANARQIAISPNDVPRLRFVGGGNEYLGVTGGFLPGTDDGVVALHSSCGATTDDGVDSCVSYRALDGKQTSVSAPAALWYNHYPVLMGSDTHHGGTIGTQDGVTLSYVNNNLDVGVSVALSTQTTTSGWWLWKSTYNTVTGSADYTMSEVLFNAVN